MNFDPVLSWYVLRTKPRQEARAIENLTGWGVENFTPWLSAQTAGYCRALFPGYIFARFNIAVMHRKIPLTRGISYIVSFGGIAAVIEDDVIAMIRNRIDEDGFVRTVMLRLGDPVVIRSGPLRNLAGVFEKELSGHARIQILLKAVGFSAHVQISNLDYAG